MALILLVVYYILFTLPGLVLLGIWQWFSSKKRYLKNKNGDVGLLIRTFLTIPATLITMTLSLYFLGWLEDEASGWYYVIYILVAFMPLTIMSVGVLFIIDNISRKRFS